MSTSGVMAEQVSSERKITGRAVFLALLAFFGVVTAVNAVMIRAATSTFGGVETESAYRVGLAFNRELAAVAEQDARHWTVDAELQRIAPGQAELAVRIRDAGKNPVVGLSLAGRLTHPVDARRDHRVELTAGAGGAFKGEIDADPGQWDLHIVASRDGDVVFRSKSRLTLR